MSPKKSSKESRSAAEEVARISWALARGVGKAALVGAACSVVATQWAWRRFVKDDYSTMSSGGAVLTLGGFRTQSAESRAREAAEAEQQIADRPHWRAWRDFKATTAEQVASLPERTRGAYWLTAAYVREFIDTAGDRALDAVPESYQRLLGEYGARLNGPEPDKGLQREIIEAALRTQDDAQ